MNNITFFSPSKSIFNNWTLKYNDNAIETTYTTTRYSITKQCVFIVITIPLSLIILCLSITSLQTNNTNTTNSANSSKYYYNTIKKYLIALTVLTAFTFVIVVCNLIVVIINKDKSHLYMQLTYITPFIQVSIFTLISECYKMWINSVKQVEYVKCVFIVEMVYRLFYDVICCNKFYIGLLSGCVVYVVMVMLSFFLNGVNTCDTVLSLCGFLCIELMVFFVERKERLVYYYLSKSNEVINTYIQFFKSKKFYFASFSNATTSASCVVNETLNSSIFTKRKSDKKVNNSNKSYYLYCGNTVIDNIIKKFCFGGFTFINPNLPITLRDIMVKISSQYNNVNNTSALTYIPHGDNNIKLFQAAKLSNAIIESIQSLFSFFKSSSTNTGSTNVSDNSTVLDVNPHFITTNISPKNKRDEHNNNNNNTNANNNANGNSNENELYYLGDKQNPKYPLKTYSIFIHEEETTSQLIYFGISKEFLSHLYHNNTNINNITNTNNNNNPSLSSSHNQLEKYAMFTSKMTHEIKNPLLAIQGEIDSLKTSIETQQSLNTKTCISSLNLLVDYCQYMLIVTKDFECVAKELKHMDMKTSIDPKPFNIRKAISFCVELIKRIKRVTGLQILISIANNIDELIISDEIRFKQIIINLLSNSVKFTRFGSVEVKCTNYNDDYIKVAVIDTGFGMKEDELRKLNANVNDDNNNNNGDTKEEKFLFIKSTKNNDFGSGLGLSIVKSLVKALGKDFKVESEYNKGTTISFKLLKRNKKNDLSPHNNNNNNIQDLPSSLSKPEKQSYSYNEHNNTDKNKHAIKHRKSLAETSGRHHLLTKPGSLGRSQTLIRNNVFFNKKHRSKNSASANNCNNHVDGILCNLSNFRKDTNESLNQVSDSMQKMLDTSNGLNVSLKELNESLSINTQRVDADLKKPKLPNEIYQNIIDGKQNIMESIKYNNDSIDPDPFASNNFKRLYTRLVTTKKDYKLMKTATLKGGGVAQPLGALSNNVQAINKNMNINNQNINININTNTQSNTKKMVDLIMDESEKIRILVVEDDNTIRKSISKTIRDYGKDNGYKVDVEECEDGFECLYKIYIGFSKNHKYKCIITDDQMRFLNGTFMAYLIHLLIEDRILYPVHIYLASSNTFPKDLFRGIKLFNDVFGKPLTKLQISQVFREFEGEGVINELNDVEEDDDERNDVFKEEDYEADEEEEEDEDNY